MFDHERTKWGRRRQTSADEVTHQNLQIISPRYSRALLDSWSAARWTRWRSSGWRRWWGSSGWCSSDSGCSYQNRTETGYTGLERLNWLVVQGQRGEIDELYWDRELKWTSYTGMKRGNGLAILGQRVKMDWLYWDREGNWTGYTGRQRGNELAILGQRGQMDWPLLGKLTVIMFGF